MAAEADPFLGDPESIDVRHTEGKKVASKLLEKKLLDHLLATENLPILPKQQEVCSIQAYNINSLSDPQNHLDELECVFASGNIPSTPPLGRLSRVLLWTPDPVFAIAQGGMILFETQCHGESVIVSNVMVPHTHIIALQARVEFVEPGEDNVLLGENLGEKVVYDGRGGMVLNFGFNSKEECGNEGRTKPFEVHGVFPGNPNLPPSRRFFDMGRVVGTTAQGGSIFLFKVFVKVAGTVQFLGWYTVVATPESTSPIDVVPEIQNFE